MKKVIFIILTIVFLICILNLFKTKKDNEKFRGAISPIPCKKGKYSEGYNPNSGIGSTQCNECLPGTYQNEEAGSVCIECPFNEYQDEYGQPSCKKCPDGTFSLNKGNKSCLKCPAGSVRKEGDEHATCMKCPKGTYQNEEGQTDCIKCKSGTYQDEEGSAFCKKCRPGWSSGEGDIECIECESGMANSREGGICKKCDGGFYQDKKGQAECLPCQAGKYEPISPQDSRKGATKCKDCQPGKYTSTIGNKECQDCPVGHYQDNSGKITCTKCDINSFSNKRGASNCDSCPESLKAEDGVKDIKKWTTSTHSTRCNINILKENWYIDENQINEDETYEELKYDTGKYKPLLMGSTVQKRVDVSDKNKMIGEKNKERLDLYEIKIPELSVRTVKFRKNHKFEGMAKYPGAQEGKITMRLYPRYFVKDSIVNPACLSDTGDNQCKKNESEILDLLNNQKKLVISFDIRKCYGSSRFRCSEMPTESLSGRQKKSELYISWANGDKAVIGYSSDDRQKGKNIIKATNKWNNFILTAIEGDQIENGIEFIFDEENEVAYQISNLTVEPYLSLEKENLIDGKYGVFNQNPLGGKEGVCPVGPWNLRVADGCCTSIASAVKGIEISKNNKITTEANAPVSISWDEDDAKNSCQMFGWFSQDLDHSIIFFSFKQI